MLFYVKIQLQKNGTPGEQMTSRHLKIFLSVFFLLSFLLASYSISFADVIPAGKIIKFKGQVQVVRAGNQTAEPASAETGLNIGDTIHTGSDGSASILLSDESMIQLNKNTDFVLKEVEQKAGWLKMRKVGAKLKGNPSVYQLNKGEAWIRNKDKDASFEVKSPTSVAGIRGTDLDMKVELDGTSTLTVMEGLVLVKNEFGSVDVNAGEQAVAKPGQAPRKVVLVTPEDAVQWTVTIPRLIDTKQIVDSGVLNAYNKLMNGEIKEAQGLLIEITSKDPNLSIAWSLLSLTEILTGKPTKALESANKGVETARDSSLAFVILSYAYQANFDLDEARASTKKALQIDDKNVYALIAQAKLLFASDYTDEALSFISKARQIAPNDPEIDTLYGFILLAQRKSEGAISAFKQALQNDPGSGEAHMGLSLAYMRKGDTATAMEEISKAVLLEPRRSLFLSYWAKMLYQVRRFDQALDILKFARQIDPNDPTPLLYSAIIYRDLNRPTEAIESINKAIELNDKKAVYRSKFLLDKDLAVKNIDLSLLYSQLGMDAWAQTKALDSTKQDYSNFSGHLFLAGALSAMEGRSLNAFNEYLLARIMQPANINALNTFNDYTTFFEKPDISGTADAFIGTQNTGGGDIITFGAIPRLNTAFSLGAFYSDTDGWRDTNSDRRINLVGLLKWDLSDNDNFMFKASLAKEKQHDIIYPAYEFDSPSDPAYSTRADSTNYELGYHHRFTPNANLLVYISSVSRFINSVQHFNVPVNPTLSVDINQNGKTWLPYYQAQIQQLLKIGQHQIILGTVHYRGDYKNSTRYQLDTVFNNNVVASQIVNNEYLKDHDYSSYYIDDIFKVNNWMTLEGALYFDRMTNSDATKNLDWKIDEISPRFAIILKPGAKDTVRLAAFQYLVPFASYRLDPSDIGGIPLYRNAKDGALTQEYDVSWEHEWNKGFASINIFTMNSDYTFKPDQTSFQTSQARLNGAEVTFNQLVSTGYGITSRYRYLDVDDDMLATAERKEHLVSAGIKHVRKNGIFAGIFETFRFLDLKAPNRNNELIWITDAQAGYEFPRKRGSVSIEARNIFNNRFNWVTDNFIFSGRNPARELLLKLSMNF